MVRDQNDLALENGFADAAHFRRTIARLRQLPQASGTQGEVQAYVNHGRWVVSCPFCAGAEMVSRAKGLFYCLSCGMAANDNHPMRVLFPRAKRQIEALLNERPVENQNWYLSETVAVLKAENLEHGLIGGLR